MKIHPIAANAKATATVPSQCSAKNYIDYADEDERDSRLQYNSLTSNQNGDHQFPVKLHYVLSEVEKDGFSHVISWQPHGRCFVVHDQEEFVKIVLSNWFRQSKFTSFQRQLNMYGFRRLTHGIDKGGYYHQLFLRGKPSLSVRIERTKVKGNGPRGPYNPESEPNFYRMKPLPCASGQQNNYLSKSLEIHSNNLKPASDNRGYVSLSLALKLPTSKLQVFKNFNPPNRHLYMDPIYASQQIINTPMGAPLTSKLNMNAM